MLHTFHGKIYHNYIAERLVSVRGTVVKVSTVKPLVVQMSFACTKCGTTIVRDFPDGKFSPPSVCVIHGCKSRSFNPIRSSARPIDFQKIRYEFQKIDSYCLCCRVTPHNDQRLFIYTRLEFKSY